MRQIKFRAWNEEVQLFIEPMSLIEIIDCARSGNLNPWMDKADKMIWQQFTGLLDKNGKEIYEGDIMKTARGIAEVYFNHGCFVLGYKGVKNWKLISKGDLVNHGSATACEIIGNIYENGDLMK